MAMKSEKLARALLKVAVLATVVAAILSTAAAGQGSVASSQHPVGSPTRYYSFCPKRTCLYYAGDFDSNDWNANALADYDNPGRNTDAAVWVGVRPTTDVTITGASGNYLTDQPQIGVNPTPFLVRTGVTSGSGGKLVCSSSGNATLLFWGTQTFLYLVNVSIARLTHPCQLKAGKKYYVNLTLEYNDNSSYAYLADEEDHPPQNHVGWPNDLDDDYWNSTSYGSVYEPTWGSSGACGGGCDEFSISLTGKRSR
jgi:hypothetical protein